MYNETIKNEVLNRLKNIKGHVSGIERMVDENQTCSNILVQLSAVRASVEKLGMYILENNAVECLCSDFKDSKNDKEKIQQIVKQMITFLK